jgi:two-component system, response regulator PdtaR
MSEIIKFPKVPFAQITESGATKSVKYRLRASQLGRIADLQTDESKMLQLVELALGWIRLAENEETLADVLTSPVVLIVEDDRLQRMESAQSLMDAGFEILEADNADHAIIMLESHPGISAVLTDVRMPGSMDGFKLAAAIRDRWPPIKVIAISGVLEADAVDMPEGGLFLPKSTGSEEIAMTLRELMSA